MTTTIHEEPTPKTTKVVREARFASGKYKEQLRAQRALRRALTKNSTPRKNPHNRELGMAGENLAVTFLESCNYIVLDRNWRCQAGEVDIVALAPDATMAFIEVKTRSSHRHGTPAEAITYTKLARMRRVMGAWFRTHEAPAHCGISLDLVSVDWDGENDPVIKHRKRLK